MAAELVGGALLGAAVGELLKVIIDVAKKTAVFKSNFERLESTMKAIIPIVKEIEEYKRVLDRSEDEIKGLVEILKNGEILVRKCGTVTLWRNVHKRPSFSKKLNELNESLIWFFNFNMQAQLVRDTSETLVEMKKMNLKIDIMGGRNGRIHQQPNGYLGSCGVPGAPAVTVGLDVPLKELKMMMSLKDGDPMIVLSAPGGCGKMTLAKKLCEDREIKGAGGGGGGIKGVRPPVLTPPPSMMLPMIDDACSEDEDHEDKDVDGVRFRKTTAISESKTSLKVHGGLSSSEDGDEDADGVICKREEVNGVRFRETAARSESCFFTTSNDDDSSSTTTESKSRNISPNGRFKRNITSWDKGKLLGQGSFGSVYEGIAEDGFFFAVKEVSLIDQGSQAKQSVFHLEQEIALLSQFEHENIVQYYGTDEDKSKLYVFLELVAKGSLMSLYHLYHLRDSQVSKYTRQILCGLKYLHDRNVVHRDIKCANILVDANGSVKLADFGLAKATKFNDVKSCQGTAFWMAPEVVNHHNQGYGLPADIWSLGCTVLEMLTRQIPYSHLGCMPALFKIGKGELPPIPDTLSRDAQDFILQCLQANPNNRPAASELLDHPFLKQLPPTPSCSAASP